MKPIIKWIWIVSWVFFAIWNVFILINIGPDVVIPMKYQAPLVLSFFGPPLIWCVYEIFIDSKNRLNETIDDKFDINR